MASSSGKAEYAFDRICCAAYAAVSWDVEFTDAFGVWWDGLNEDEQASVAFVVGLLEERGVTLGFPYVCPSPTRCSMTIFGSSHHGKRTDMARKFAELRAGMSADRRARVAARTTTALKEMPLHELRRARELTQTALAEAMGTSQGEVSKIEQRADLYVSTLRKYLEAMGGELEIVARFPDGSVKIMRFGELQDA